VLSGVIAAFVLAAIWALLRANHMVASRQLGSLNWFLDALKLDLEVLSRSLAEAPAAAEHMKKAPDDLAA
jgi:hypothetical protein